MRAKGDAGDAEAALHAARCAFQDSLGIEADAHVTIDHDDRNGAPAAEPLDLVPAARRRIGVDLLVLEPFSDKKARALRQAPHQVVA